MRTLTMRGWRWSWMTATSRAPRSALRYRIPSLHSAPCCVNPASLVTDQLVSYAYVNVVHKLFFPRTRNGCTQGSYGALKTLIGLEFYFQNSRPWKCLNLPWKALNLLMSIYLLHINICMHNYAISVVSKCVNIASKCVNIALCKYRIMRSWSCGLLTDPLGGAVVQWFLSF